jgi:hypothetical protein
MSPNRSFEGVKPGDWVDLINSQYTVNRCRQTCPNTIGYEVLTGLGRRYARTYFARLMIACLILFCSPVRVRRETAKCKRARMAKRRSSFICQNCGTEHPRWIGKCDGCGAWNSLVEESASGGGGALGGPAKGSAVKGRVGRTFLARSCRRADCRGSPPGSLGELDRVTGGGFVRGSALLVGGDPGIGKSTLLMQVTAALAQKNAG